MAVRRSLIYRYMGAPSRISSCKPKYFLRQAWTFHRRSRRMRKCCVTQACRGRSNESDMAVIDADVPLAEDVEDRLRALAGLQRLFTIHRRSAAPAASTRSRLQV